MKTLIIILFAFGLYVNQLSNEGVLSERSCDMIITSMSTITFTKAFAKSESASDYKTLIQAYTVTALCNITPRGQHYE